MWDLISSVYPERVCDNKDKYFIPDYIYACNGKDEVEQDEIQCCHCVGLPGFLIKGWNGIKPPYLVGENKDNQDKEHEA